MPAFDPQRYTIRPYTPADNEKCKYLEHAATMVGSRWKKMFVQPCFLHYRDFDAKASQFEDHAVLVAEVRDTGYICGCVCLGIKRVTHLGRPTTLGYLFDLRVHEDHQRNGIGAELSEEAERAAWAKGADLLYLSVNGDNRRAERLYHKLGYTRCSTRSPAAVAAVPSITELLLPEAARGSRSPPPHDVTFTACPDERLLAEYRKHDMWLCDEGAILRSEFFIGFLTARAADGSIASLGLWNTSALTGFKFARMLFLPEAVWASTAFQLCFLVPPLWAMCRVLGAGLSVASGAIAALIALATLAGVRLRNHVKACLGSDQLRLRLFAPLAQGPQGGELFKSVLQVAYRYGFDNKFLVAVCNVDERDPLRASFSSASGLRTFLMAKSPAGKPPPEQLETRAFFDPRDI